MEIKEGKLVLVARLTGSAISIVEDTLIDTGSTFTILPPEVADKLKLKVYRRMPKVNLTTASGFIEAPVRLLNQIEIGGLGLDNIPVVIHRIPDPAPVKILIGMNLLQRAKLVVNGKENEFKLDDP